MLNIELFGGKMATEIKHRSFDKSFKKKMQNRRKGIESLNFLFWHNC